MELTNKTYTEEEYINEEYVEQEGYQWPWFERIYFFVMLIYAAQMTPDTARMIQNLSGNPIPLLIPIVLTAILLIRNPISFADRRLWMVVGITGAWSLASILKYQIYTTAEFSYHFFLYYAIFIAYIHIKVFGLELMSLYEKTMVLMCKIAIPLWLFCLLVPSIATPFFDLFPETGFGHNFLYIFNKINANVYPEYPFLRNAGFSWEPGRFSIMICFAILFNIQSRGVTFFKNSNIYWLLATLISTESTTGYSTVIALYAIHLINNWSFKNIIITLLIFIPVAYNIFQLDFMFGKILGQYENLENLETMIQNSGEYSEKTIALDRMPSFAIEWTNFLKDPILGYGRNYAHASLVLLTGGLMQMLSQYGLFLGLFFYTILFKSSRAIGTLFYTNKYGLLICALLSLFSYPLFIIPLFTAFWLFGVFNDENSDYFLEEDIVENESI